MEAVPTAEGLQVRQCCIDLGIHYTLVGFLKKTSCKAERKQKEPCVQTVQSRTPILKIAMSSSQPM
jgi:hypothetical protein